MAGPRDIGAEYKICKKFSRPRGKKERQEEGKYEVEGRRREFGGARGREETSSAGRAEEEQWATEGTKGEGEGGS